MTFIIHENKTIQEQFKCDIVKGNDIDFKKITWEEVVGEISYEQ